MMQTMRQDAPSRILSNRVESENNWLQLAPDHMVAASRHLSSALVLAQDRTQVSSLPSTLGAPFSELESWFPLLAIKESWPL